MNPNGTLADFLATIPPHASVEWCAVVRAALPTLMFDEDTLWRILAQRVRSVGALEARRDDGFDAFDEFRILLESVGVQLVDHATLERMRRNIWG